MLTQKAIEVSKEVVGYLKGKVKLHGQVKHLRELFEERCEAVQTLIDYCESKQDDGK